MRWAGIARLATSWAIAFALLLQIVAMAVSPIAPAGPLVASEICHSADDGAAPDDTQGRLVVHLKCIACVLACSSPPPTTDAAAPAQFAWARYRPGWPLAAVLPEGASLSSHFARGPPIAA